MDHANRENSSNASLWALLALIPWMVAIGIVLNDWYKEVQLGKRAVVTSGIITNIELENHYQYDYEYFVDNQKYKGGEIVPGNTSLGVGHRVRVSYIPESPQTSTLTTFGETGTRPVPILLCVFAGLYCYVRLRRFLRPLDNSYDQ